MPHWRHSKTRIMKIIYFLTAPPQHSTNAVLPIQKQLCFKQHNDLRQANTSMIKPVTAAVYSLPATPPPPPPPI